MNSEHNLACYSHTSCIPDAIHFGDAAFKYGLFWHAIWVVVVIAHENVIQVVCVKKHITLSYGRLLSDWVSFSRDNVRMKWHCHTRLNCNEFWQLQEKMTVKWHKSYRRLLLKWELLFLLAGRVSTIDTLPLLFLRLSDDLTLLMTV